MELRGLVAQMQLDPGSLQPVDGRRQAIATARVARHLDTQAVETPQCRGEVGARNVELPRELRPGMELRIGQQAQNVERQCRGHEKVGRGALQMIRATAYYTPPSSWQRR